MKTDTAIALHSTKLLDRVKEAIRYKHYRVSTEQAKFGARSVIIPTSGENL